jgi:U2 small nuclear ribonucleoprotein B''
MTMNQPNPTLYVKNIDWKVKKGLLRRALYSLFSRHGKVLEVIALRKDGLRGQAFIVMEDVQAATAALQAEQGFTFFGKDLIIEYARAKSDRIAKRDGDYVPKSKRRKIVQEAVKKEDEEDDEASEAEEAEPKTEETAVVPMAEAPAGPSEPPSKILLAQDLPDQVNEFMLGMLFQQYAGYKEVRIPRPGLAFVEFEDEPHATVAMKALNGFKLTQDANLKLDYGKA